MDINIKVDDLFDMLKQQSITKTSRANARVTLLFKVNATVSNA
jgi:hypothetical protein